MKRMHDVRLILASGSPRRRELLAELHLPFQIVTADVEELDGGSAPQLTPPELALENARRKAEAVSRRNPGAWVLGADTVVTLEGRIFGKPASLTQAREFLRAFSGRTHQVVTGCVLKGPDGREEIFDEISSVTFLPLSEENITRYLDAVEVLDKAGGYALQERGEWIVANIEGSRTNIIGLPMEKLTTLLRNQGLL
jgi:septum formation protein